MKTPLMTSGADRGSITVLFVLISGLLVGMVGYSLYVGQVVTQKMELQNAGDAATFTMAEEAAQGLNMISANNLAIGASIHINTSVEILASYLSMYRALTASATDITEALSLITDAAGVPVPGWNDKIQKDIWNKLAPLSSYAFHVGSGVVEFNDFLENYWLAPAPIRGAEALRLNKPDSIFIPIQMSQPASDLSKVAFMKFAGLRKTTPKETVCHSLRASRGIDQADRDNILLWLMGPLLSLGNSDGGALKVIGEVTSNIEKFMPLKIGYMDCGYGLKTPIFQMLDKLSKTINGGAVSQIVMNAIVLTREDSVVNSYFGEVRKTDFHCGLNPVCHTYEAGCRVVLETLAKSIATTASIFQPSLVDAYFLSKEIEGMKQNTDTTLCNGQKGKTPVLADEKATVLCFDIASIDAECPKLIAFQEQGLLVGVCSEYGSHMDSVTRNEGDKCGEYLRWRKASKANPEPQKDTGIAIKNTGNQAKAFADGVDVGEKELHWTVKRIVENRHTRPTLYQAFDADPECHRHITIALTQGPAVHHVGFPNLDVQREHAEKHVCVTTEASDQKAKADEKQLGFLIPSKGEGGAIFENSLRFGAVVTLPLRTRKEIPMAVACPPELISKDSDQKDHCDFQPVISLVTNQGARTEATDKARDAINLNQAGMTKLVQDTQSAHAAFSSEWQRSLWILSESRVKYRPKAGIDPEHEGEDMRTFYPAWTSVYSTMTANSIETALKPLLSTAQADKALALISLVKGAPNGR